MVQLPLPDAHRARDRFEWEPPVAGEGEVVVNPAVEPAGQGPADACRLLLGVLPREDRPVAVRNLGANGVGDLRAGDLAQLLAGGAHPAAERLLSLECRAELVEVELRHPVEPVEPLGAPGRDGDQRSRRQATVRQQRGAGDRVWAAARSADGEEGLDPERVGQGCDVSRHVGHAPPGVAGRSRIARTAESDQAEPPRSDGLRPGRKSAYLARRTVVGDEADAAGARREGDGEGVERVRWHRAPVCAGRNRTVCGRGRPLVGKPGEQGHQ